MNGLQAVVEYLVENEAELRAAVPSANFEQALFGAREMFQYYDADVAAGKQTSIKRDGHMAANIQHIKELVGKETRLLLWAHNRPLKSGLSSGSWAAPNCSRLGSI